MKSSPQLFVISFAVAFAMIIVLFFKPVQASDLDGWTYEPPWHGGCPSFTQEQLDVLVVAIEIGGHHDKELYAVIGDNVRYTTMAIVSRESFVGEYIIRQNPRDGVTGSYGVMHVLVTTAFADIYEMGYTWRNRSLFESEWIVSMLTDDRAAIRDGYAVLKSKIIQHGSLWAGVKAYNGAGHMAERYMQDVRYRVNKLIDCGY